MGVWGLRAVGFGGLGGLGVEGFRVWGFRVQGLGFRVELDSADKSASPDVDPGFVIVRAL